MRRISLVGRSLVFCLVALATAYSAFAGREGSRRVSPLDDLIPHSVSPANDSVFQCIPQRVKLVWSTGTSFDNSYFVEVSVDSSFTTPIISDVVVFDTVDFIAVPRADTMFYWRVRTQFDTTAIWRFKLKTGQRTTTASPSKDTITDNPVHFFWHPMSGVGSYELYIESNAYTRSDTVKDTSAWVTLLGYKSYTWKVRGLCGDGATDWSNQSTFYLNVETNGVYADASNSETPWRLDSRAKRLFYSAQPGPERQITVLVYDLLGSVVSQRNLSSATEGSLDLSKHQRGAYMIVWNDESRSHQQFVILD